MNLFDSKRTARHSPPVPAAPGVAPQRPLSELEVLCAAGRGELPYGMSDGAARSFTRGVLQRAVSRARQFRAEHDEAAMQRVIALLDTYERENA